MRLFHKDGFPMGLDNAKDLEGFRMAGSIEHQNDHQVVRQYPLQPSWSPGISHFFLQCFPENIPGRGKYVKLEAAWFPHRMPVSGVT